MRGFVTGLRKLGGDIYDIVTSLERTKALLRHPLYSNAIYIMFAKAVDAVVGLVFWIVAARLYATEEVGQASALLSAATLLTMLSGLGFGYGLIRFLGGSKNPGGLINSTFLVVSLVSVVAALIYVVGPGLWSPAVVSLRQHPGYVAVFMLAVPVASVAGLADNIFIARRTAGFVLARNMVFNTLRLALPIALAAYLQSFGLFSSWGMAVGVSLVLSILLFLPRAQPGYRPSLSLDRQAVGGMLRFSVANYLSDVFWTAPILILQSVLVVRILGAESNAYLAVAWAMGNALSALPSAVSLSLFAEGSHDESKLGQSLRQGLKMTFLILTPAVILVALLADKILLVFRPEYAESASTLLRLFALSAFPVAINSLYFGTKRVQRKMTTVILLILLAGAITLGLSSALMRSLDITAVGIAWLAGQSCVCLIVVAASLRGNVKVPLT